ncbi:DUF4834 domain-containing protein [Prevotella aurantiaca]|jgi:hypothetical protein|uniref:DUF4834 domain-containing protein n=1 Tax=Prevotella aurantiaca TaxID=596085 RepID=A0A930HP58_9BACT|nr:DUF4834 domain-containing protein [Prevotella aurantiaca]MBF1385248.1 DUF4834 domain-containing protein [Prevotella aurantiaca]MBF1387015.1 DUF4834 domain-containing protein [Prevotella aurantiaca]
MIILKFAFFIFVAFLVTILLIAYKFYKIITRTQRRFRPEDVEEGVNVDGNTIVDKRPEYKRNKQVISDDEGEYVDFIDSDISSEDKKL